VVIAATVSIALDLLLILISSQIWPAISHAWQSRRPAQRPIALNPACLRLPPPLLPPAIANIRLEAIAADGRSESGSKKSGNKPQKLKARLPRGLADGTCRNRRHRAMVEAIRAVFERYGFEPWRRRHRIHDALGKFLPTRTGRTKAFSFQDDDEQC